MPMIAIPAAAPSCRDDYFVGAAVCESVPR